MTLDDIQGALSDAMQTGKLGTPVAARVHLLVDGEVNIAGAVERIAAMLSPCFELPSETVRARRHASGRVSSLLMQTGNGRTIFISIGQTDRPALHLLVVGNHGVLRLEGGDCLEPVSFDRTENEWSAQIAESCESGKIVRLNYSM